MNFRTYSDMSKLIHDNLSIIAEQNFDLIVGIPRSGVVPAHMIGLSLNVNTCLLNDLLEDNAINRDGGRVIKQKLTQPSQAKKILLVDDSINSARSLRRNLDKIPDNIRKKIKILCVYGAPDSPKGICDYLLEVVPFPRTWEWNIMHHPILQSSAIDLDGVLCRDPTSAENDDGEKYKMFIKNTQPRFIPTYKVKTIITSRLEKYRVLTEEWLKRYGVEYEKLIMLEGYTAEERRLSGVHGKFKAKEYKKPHYTLFIESNYEQALEINKLTGKPVYCVDHNTMINKRSLQTYKNKATIANLKEFAKKNTILRLSTKMPYRLIRKVYRLTKSNTAGHKKDIYKQNFHHKIDRKLKVVNIGFGTNNNEYALAKKAVEKSHTKNFVVFSAGIYNDIEFEKAMIQKYNATVYSFDPTPLSARFVKEQISSGRVDEGSLIHTKCGVDGQNRTVEFNVLSDSDGGVGSSAISRVDDASKYYPRKIKVKMKTIQSLMKDKGIENVDCMKLDIEGSEFEVIENAFNVKNPLKIPNLIIEFHERFFIDGEKKMDQAFRTLKKAGYIHVWTSKLGIEYLFVHTHYLNNNSEK